MNRSLKSVLALVILVSLVACAMGWTVGGIEGVPSSRFWMRVSGLLAVGALILLLRAEFRQDLAPDFLRRGVKAYFEQNGLCLAVLPSVENNHFAWQILFQNRFERACRSTIAFRPAAPTFGFRKPTLSGVKVEIDCPGGAFGFVSIPYQVESEYQTKQVQFELIASTTFPDGKGRCSDSATAWRSANAINQAWTSRSRRSACSRCILTLPIRRDLRFECLKAYPVRQSESQAK